MLRKVVYPYEYTDNWGGFHDTLLPEKKEFYSKLTIEGITDAY